MSVQSLDAAAPDPFGASVGISALGSVVIIPEAIAVNFNISLIMYPISRFFLHVTLAWGLLSANSLFAQTLSPAIATQLDACDVSWDKVEGTSAASMPIGNGDIGLNVWVEANGDISFYIGKTDAWDQGGLEGPRKLGAVHISMNPPAVGPGVAFTQILKLHEGEIEITEGAAKFRIWVDANNPVIRMESQSAQPFALKVVLDDWRVARPTPQSKDVILPNQANRIAWYHRDDANGDLPTRNLTFGGVIKGEGFASQDASTLQSDAATSHVLSIYPLTATTDTPEQWLALLEPNITRIDALDLERTRTDHQKWWDEFWNRSWIFVRGDDSARAVTEGYILQRFVTACAGRGAYPIKFNGSIFVVDNPDFNRDNRPSVDADYRSWGGQYWFQNTRLIYWPMLAAGDFDLMQPLFKMYTAELARNAAQVKAYYKHGGSYIAETAPFCGGLKYAGPEALPNATLHYFTPVLELSMMMLDYYEYTGDQKFAREILLPTATTGIQFFNEHFGRDADGKLLLDPDNAIETFHKAHDPAPDIAGLTAVTRRLLALPDTIVDADTRKSLLDFQKLILPLPTGKLGDQTVLLPYSPPLNIKRVGPENPELYAVFPFRLYGVGKPDFQMALATFNARLSKGKGGWSQEPIHSAIMGQTDLAKSNVVFDFTNKDPRQKFPAFWTSQQDYAPNQCNGGSGEEGLQKMLVQTDGKTLLLLPAWPKGWDADFKLHAPGQTTVQGSISNGKIVNLVVTPSANASRVIDMSSLSATAPK